MLQNCVIGFIAICAIYLFFTRTSGISLYFLLLHFVSIPFNCWLFAYASTPYFLCTFAGFFFFHHLRGIGRQDKCITETVAFNSNFVEFMLPFLGIDQTKCSCDQPCQSIDRFVRLYIYRTYVYWWTILLFR